MKTYGSRQRDHEEILSSLQDAKFVSLTYGEPMFIYQLDQDVLRDSNCHKIIRTKGVFLVVRKIVGAQVLLTERFPEVRNMGFRVSGIPLERIDWTYEDFSDMRNIPFAAIEAGYEVYWLVPTLFSDEVGIIWVNLVKDGELISARPMLCFKGKRLAECRAERIIINGREFEIVMCPVRKMVVKG